MTNKQTKLFAVGAMFAAMAMSSCVDNAYDLDNVDMLVGTTGDITLPNSSTSDIILKNILDLEEEGVIVEVEDEYFVSKADKVDIDPLEVKEVSMSPKVTPKRFPLIGQPGENGAVLFPIPEEGDRRVFLPIEDGISDDVSEDITDIHYIGIVDKDKHEMVLSVDIKSDKLNATRYHIDNFELDVPTGWHLKSATCNGAELLTTTQAKEDVKNTGRLMIRAGKDEEGFSTNADIHLKLCLEGIGVADDYDAVFDKSMHRLKFKNNAGFQMKGTYRVEKSEQKSTFGNTIATSLATSFPKFYLTHLAGEGHVNIDPTEADLGEMPDFLTDESTCLDLTNPVLFIKFGSPIDGEAVIEKARFVGVKGDKELAAVEAADPIHILSQEGQRTNILVLADHKNDEAAADFGFTIPEAYKGCNLVFVRVPNLKSLLVKIPEQINMEFTEGIQLKADDLLVPATYEMDVEYNLYTPIALGPDFNLVYRYTETDWDLDDDYTKLNAGYLVVTGRIDNELGAALDFSLELLDGAAKKIPFIDIQPIPVPADAKNYPIKMILKPSAGHTVNDVLRILDGMSYVATLNQPLDNETTLKNDTPIRLYKLRVTAKGGVSYDAN